MRTNPPELVERIVASYGRISAGMLARELTAELGVEVSRNRIIGIWGRKRAAGELGPMPEIADKVEHPTSSRSRARTAETIAAEALPEVVETAPAPVEPASAPAPKPAKVHPAPPVELLPIAPALAQATLVLVHLTGAAAAYRDADPDGRRTCRWPHGDPRDADFRFCGEVVTTPTVRGNDGHARVQPYCEACRERARGRNQAARSTAPMLGHSAHAGPRAVKAGGLRFGRAG